MPSLWREVKAYQFFDAALGRHRAYAYITTEAPGGGLQIIDLTNLPNSVTLANTLASSAPRTRCTSPTSTTPPMRRLPGATAYLFIAGANVAGGAFRIYDLANPVAPTLVTSPPAGTGYMHDSTSMLITDNRTTQCANAHNPCEVLVDFNETVGGSLGRHGKGRAGAAEHHHLSHRELRALGLADRGQHASSSCTTNSTNCAAASTRTSTRSISRDLRAPSLVTSYIGGTTSTDHNGYTIGNRYYVSHYKRGLVIFDVTNPRALTEIGSFDTYLSPSANSAGTDGAWGVYPFLPSGTLLVSDIENGMFLLQKNETLPRRRRWSPIRRRAAARAVVVVAVARSDPRS